MGFLIGASILFYAAWNITHLLLLLASAIGNYLMARWMKHSYNRRFILIVGIIFNLIPLIYYKYGMSLHLSSYSLVLPLAISFYTFQQIAFLVDLYKKNITLNRFSDYLFFVLFFPQLVAGPIVHYRQIIEQIQKGVFETVKWNYIQAGTVLFSIGLFKKVILADQFFPIANKAFEHIVTLHSIDAWIGIVAYSYGIYFDFSGYTDMAIGLALLFGIYLPVNFFSPYKAVNMVDFWRRWHITLSHFLRDYIYIPLGGNRKGSRREGYNLLITMILGGIWHGAGWTFLLWGFFHGLLLVFIHLKQYHFPQWNFPKNTAIAFTFIAVTLLWVLFRADNFTEAWHYYLVLFNFNMTQCLMNNTEILLLLGGAAVIWFVPNSMEIVKYQSKIRVKRFYAVWAAVLFFIALKMMAESPVKSFVYFNF